MKKTCLFITLIFILLLPLSAGITFSGGNSRMVMQDGKNQLSLTEGARVTIDTLMISASSITLSGDDYSLVKCEGNIIITDSSKGLDIRTGRLYFDRNANTLTISSWCEISDASNELEASAASLIYDMDKEILSLEMQVQLLKSTDSGIMRCRAEKMEYRRSAKSLSLFGDAEVYWKTDTYKAESMRINLETNEISLDGNIKGTIHG